MILQTGEPSPSQSAALEKMVGRKIQNQKNAPLWGSKAKVASAAEREQSARQMRYQLYLLDPSERRMSIEDCAAALLEKPGMTA